MQKVLCVCKGNTCRSPMMQQLLQRELGDEFIVESGGTNPAAAGYPANEHSVLCMSERGIDIADHRSRWIGNLDLTEYTHIICVGTAEGAQVLEHLGDNTGPMVMVANAENGGVPNPYQLGLGAYRDCLALLDEVMPVIARTIRNSD